MFKLPILTLLVLLTYSEQLFAYVGPGSGLSAIGAMLALISGIVIAILGFLWYPLKRLLKKKTPEQEPDEPIATPDTLEQKKQGEDLNS